MFRASFRLRFSSRSLLLASLTVLFTNDNGWTIGPQSVLVVTTTKSPEGLAMANYYCEKRGIPTVNIVRTRIEPEDRVDPTSFKRNVTDIVDAHVRKYGLERKVSVWVTTVGLPTVIAPDNGISGVVYFGDRMEPNPNPQARGTFAKENEYLDKMIGWRRPSEIEAGGFLHMRLDSGTPEQTRELVDRSIKADGSFPRGTIYLFDGEGPRGVRKDAIPGAMTLISMLSIPVEHRMAGTLTGATNVLGWHTGVPSLFAGSNQYVPGALADHLTSFGGSVDPKHHQTPAIDFLKAGCSATYGTVVEPFNYPAKFPIPHLFGYYGLGFTAVESYWMSVRWPQQGLFMGDPLTRPFEKPISLKVERLRPEEEVKGTIDFDVIAEAAGPGAGIRGIEVSLNGKRVHQRGFLDIPAQTKVSIKMFGKTVEYTSLEKKRLADVVAAVSQELARAGFQIATKPGMIVILPPAGAPADSASQVSSSSPILKVEVLGNQEELPTDASAKTTTANIQWRLEGECGEGDRFILVIREEDKEVARAVGTSPFARPAATLTTALLLEMNKNLPHGYRLEPTLDPANAQVADIKLVAMADRAQRRVTAVLNHEAKPNSKLVVKGAGQATSLASSGPMGQRPVAIRFGLGPVKLKTRPVIDTTTFPEGRHRLEILTARGGATDSSLQAEVPIVIRNKKARIRLEPIAASLSVRKPGKTKVAKVVAPDDLVGHVRFWIDAVEVPAADVTNDTLSVDASYWGEGNHVIEADWVEGLTSVQRADNALPITIAP